MTTTSTRRLPAPRPPAGSIGATLGPSIGTDAPGNASEREDNRAAPRKTTRSGAMLRFDNSRPQQPVTVQDISATGAKLTLLGVVKPAFGMVSTMPDEFKLVITNDRIEVDCKLAWQRGVEIGVVFQSGFRPVRMLGKSSEPVRRR